MPQFAPQRPTATAMRGSIGMRDGDYVELSNKWARVTITREGSTYHVRGDTLDGPFVGGHVGSAYSYAFESLRKFEQGRAD